jgi:hypothetical protein
MSQLFTKENSKTKVFPVVGLTSVYMKHDTNFGKCLIHNGNFVTPNMPKIGYALCFSVNDKDVIVRNEMNPQIIRAGFKQAWAFEKRDGFNCLFYEYHNNLIPKTRGGPIATGEISKLIDEPAFPLDNIFKMVVDGYVPVFEVWGSLLDERNILHGRVNVREVERRENLPPLNVDLIGAMSANSRQGVYEWIDPEQITTLAWKYGLTTPPFCGIVSLDPKSIFQLMRNADALNQKANSIVTEGYVLHVKNESGSGMFKVKPIPIMAHDVTVDAQIPPERVRAEISKLLVETPSLDVSKSPASYFAEVLAYLKEDYRVTRRSERGIKQIFIEEIANKLANLPDLTKPWALGVHPMFLGQLRRELAKTEQPTTSNKRIKPRRKRGE